MKTKPINSLEENLEILEKINADLDNDPSYQSDILSALFFAQVRNIMDDKKISIGDLAARLKLGVDDIDDIINEKVDTEDVDFYPIAAIACALNAKVTITLTQRE